MSSLSGSGIGHRSILFFTATVVRAVVGFAMVPLVTRILTPHDMGIAGLVLPISAIGIVLAASFSSLSVSRHYQTLDAVARRSFLATQLAAAMAVAILLAAAVLAATPWLDSWIPSFAAVPENALSITVAAMVIAVPWVLASDVVTVEGRATVYAWTLIAQVLAGAAATLIGLYVLDAGVMALFAANLAAALAGLGGACYVLLRHLRAWPTRRWFGEIRSHGVEPFVANLVNVGQLNLERNLLASWAGLSALGLFTHSLAYQSMLAEMVKAVSRAVWPRTLAEARDTQSQFADTRSIWAGIYIGMTGVGIGAALLGKPFVAFLTHDQFTAAYVLLPFWVVAMIVQNMGRPQLGILLSGSGGRSYSQVSLIGNLGWLVALLVLLPYVGLVAAVLAITCQFAVMRVGIWLLARRVRRTSGPDRVALTGASGILLVFGAVEFLQPSLTARFVWCAVLLVALAAVCRRPLLDTAAHFRSRRPSPA